MELKENMVHIEARFKVGDFGGRTGDGFRCFNEHLVCAPAPCTGSVNWVPSRAIAGGI